VFVDNAGVDVRLQLERVLHRVQLSAVELELQPEVFQATEELRLASGELASVIEELESSNPEWSAVSVGGSFLRGRPRMSASPS